MSAGSLLDLKDLLIKRDSRYCWSRKIFTVPWTGPTEMSVAGEIAQPEEVKKQLSSLKAVQFLQACLSHQFFQSLKQLQNKYWHVVCRLQNLS